MGFVNKGFIIQDIAELVGVLNNCAKNLLSEIKPGRVSKDQFDP